MPKIIHFEIPVDDPERAVKFYQDAFDWKVQKWDNPQVDYWLVTAGDEKEPGINGAFSPRGEDNCVTNTIDVPDVDEYVKKIESAGGKILAPKMVIPGVGYMAYFQDPEGNLIEARYYEGQNGTEKCLLGS